MSDNGIASNTPRSCLITRTPSPSEAASAGSSTSSSSPPGPRTTTREWSGRPGCANRGTCSSIAASSRIVIHGNPLRGTSPRTNAQRRSPANPAQPTSTAYSASAAIDLTGYRHSPATRPTSPALTRPYPDGRMPEIKDSILDTIGDTPLVRLSRIGAGLKPQIVAKLESFNPGGSIKDRVAIR